jgi:LytS/YehU family sensor histidine kinase
MMIAILEMPGQLIVAYSVVYFVLPYWFRTRAHVKSLLWFLVIFLIIGVIGHSLFVVAGLYEEVVFYLDLPKILVLAFYSFLKACIFIVIKLIVVWHEHETKAAEMEKHRVATELKMLKDQVNPHFMFNTLNNLYGLIENDPLKARESVLGFSGILHYMLYESNSPNVPIQKEIQCIEEYIELEKLRYPGNLSVALNIQDEIKELSIIPLSLFPFVENSFKHGASEAIRLAWINIDLSVFKNEFIFKIENSKVEGLRPRSGGIGLTNVKRRLELLYGAEHKLQIFDDGERFLVVLKIAFDVMMVKKLKTYEAEMSYR